MSGIALYKYGYCMIMDHARNLPPKKGGGIRGKLDGKASSASFRRLRAWCIKHEVHGECWGITLTVPGLDILSSDQFKSIHHKLCVWANDNALPLVWRVELQKRGQPHLHCVAFCDVQTVMRLVLQWYKLLDGMPLVYNAEFIGKGVNQLVQISRAYLHGSQYAIDLQKLRGDFRAWRYLVAHMAKGKKDQLGWAGRNWGVCNRAIFEDVQPENHELSDPVFYRVRRWVRRMTRIKARRGASFMLGNPETVKRMIEFARNADDVPF